MATTSVDHPLDRPLPRAEAEATAALLKAVADPVRLQLLSLIRSAEGSEACVCDLTAAVGLSQPTVSHHMRKLVDAGLLTREQRGVWAYYSLRHDAIRQLGEVLRFGEGAER